jgi:Mn2+/Fe2+ NRAMP family transporter
MGLFTFLLIAGGALVVLFPQEVLIQFILVSQAIQGLLLPIVLAFVLKLAGDRRVMGDAANGPVSRVVGWGVAVGASVLSIAYVVATAAGLA